MDCSMPGLPVPHHFPEFVQVHVHWSSDAIQPSHPLSPSSTSVFSLSKHQGLFQQVDCISWPKYWSFSFNISLSSEYSGLISFGIDWFDLLAAHGTLKSLLQHHNSVQFSHSVVSDSLPPHESQHARSPCPSPTPAVHSNSRPSSQWCHPAISSSVVPFSSCPQSLPASGSFPVSQLFSWGGQSIGVSASASVLPMNT